MQPCHAEPVVAFSNVKRAKANHSSQEKFDNNHPEPIIQREREQKTTHTMQNASWHSHREVNRPYDPWDWY